ncbi:MAG: DNA adenine methylase [Spirochaetales bacterium]|nr:DNA adenine methylase [Spirochaetales bacterium]
MTSSHSAYLENHLIAYIGNKRRLLPLIREAIEQTGVNADKASFLDLFAGSGSVSRLAKSMGFAVTSNDWEFYSFVINKTFLECDEQWQNDAFVAFGGTDAVIDILNNLPVPKKKDEYIAKFYCPSSDVNPDLDNDRMFYTNYNGKKIDAIRNQIDKWAKSGEITQTEEYFLLSLLLYEASTRSNTSGVFKGFHCGFGGSHGDALARIMKPVQLVKPQLINGRECHVYREDAVKLAEANKETHFDIVYLDPPYNQHQYGSNYHLLNTIALNDKPAVNEHIMINKKKVNKSAIRQDWVKTKSTFCYKKSAKDDFAKIIGDLNADHILVSYSTDGIITIEDMLDILSLKGKVGIVMSEYVKFRGGKQSLENEVHNIEFILTLDTNTVSTPADIDAIYRKLISHKITMTAKKTVNPMRAEAVGYTFTRRVGENHRVMTAFSKKYEEVNIGFELDKNKIVSWSGEYDTDKMSLATLRELYQDFEYMTNMTKEDELYLTLDGIVRAYYDHESDKCLELFEDIPYLLSKFNNKKAFIPSLKGILAVLRTLSETVTIWRELELNYNAYFEKFEKILFMKLNYLSKDEQAMQLKYQIGDEYDALIENLTKPVQSSGVKSSKIKEAVNS